MNVSQPSTFHLTTPVRKILEKLMVENWTWSATYEKYFNVCRPAVCIYTDTMRNDTIYIATTVIGLIGGLMTVLALAVPRFVGLLRRKKMQRNNGNGKKDHKTSCH